jgi:CO/xanthine dehydrogenase Mo-binding subunit
MKTMSVSNWTDTDTARALQVWADYQQHHDVAHYLGQTVGIDPVSGRIWFGESATAIRSQMDAEGLDAPLLCLRVGHDYYVRKGGRR